MRKHFKLLSEWGYRAMYVTAGKRIFDIFISVLAGFILLPIMIIVAFAIKLFDPGPIIFRQIRIGQNGDEFVFYKFRSMPTSTKNVPSDELGVVSISKIGKFIRRTNLDELPQLYNVIIGDMSIVGPRPPISTQIDLITLRKMNGALSCIPGLTGWAQVNSFNGMTVQQKADLDGQYAQNISLFFDIKIILRTFAYILSPPPVY